MKSLVQINNDQLVTNSILVAEKFNKQHRHVIDSIRKILTSAENSAVLCVKYTDSPQNCGQFYQIAIYEDDKERVS
ncbi:Rha family transcriptional regulator [Bacteroidales bacterium OttesenSCG-928-A17]|nr:Rha family transcriptional regulator [Bacteroidales bacterium OttesenSCG-928-A17]